MSKESLPRLPDKEPGKRLDRLGWRWVSILIFMAAAVVLLYTIYRTQFLIAIIAGVFFLMLWFIPVLWNWVVFVFGRKPETLWERLSLNLVLATLAALTFEDALEVIMRVGYFLSRFFK